MANDIDTITQDVPDAPAAAGEGAAVEVNLDGVAFSLDDEPATGPAAPAATAPAAVAAPIAPVAPAAEPKGRGDLRKALHEERSRAKFWKGQAEGLRKASEREQPLNVRAPRLDPAEVQKISEEAEKEVGFGRPVAKVLEVVDRQIQAMAVAVEQSLRTQEFVRLERRFVRDHPDYYETLQRAGIYQAVSINPSTRQPNDPRIAKLIYEEGSDHPPEAAYYIAKSLLGEAVDEPVHDEPTRPGGPQQTLSPPPASPTPPQVPQQPQPDAVVEAERRGARQVAERVIDNSSKPKGIRVLRSAGAPPKIVLDEAFRRHLDSEMDRAPQEVMTFFDKNPAVRKWWES